MRPCLPDEGRYLGQIHVIEIWVVHGLIVEFEITGLFIIVILHPFHEGLILLALLLELDPVHPGVRLGARIALAE